MAELNNFPGARRAHGDRVLAPLEDQLGPEAYREATEWGAATSYDGFVDHAVGELHRLIAESGDG